MYRLLSRFLLGLALLLMPACSSLVKPEGRLKIFKNTSWQTEWQIPEGSFSLGEPGPFFTGKQDFWVVDKSRDDRKFLIEILYPAIQEVGSDGKPIVWNAVPDNRWAPYPLILTEHRSANWLFDKHLSSHGFVVAIITVPDHNEYTYWDYQMIDWPRDFLFGLEQIAKNPPKELKDTIDAQNVGVTGYSFGGDISLTLSGARIDPQFYLSFCDLPPTFPTSFGGDDWYLHMCCDLSDKWDAFSAFTGSAITTSEDGLWLPISDDRIRAVVPMAPSGTWLYGQRGLAAVEKPVLIIAPTLDEFIPYQEETVFLFENLGATQKSLVSFIGKDHLMITDPEIQKRIRHFVTAFFGFHLQGMKEYEQYFSQTYVSQFDDLYWGVVPEE